ncbi:Hypothetical predicted protein [Marmota monax]|uniref:ubiquitinyl hydrolase 1 n=2 Tax=Marmota monax TaxID=9995 RepID=A0A5E4B336_MARMO|nr:Hypothetical predicted protein [Marmota monax]
MSGGASATGPRRGPPGLEEATSKKKQKDRANQESKDGDPRRGSVPNPQEEHTKEELLLDWGQNENEVIVKLRVGAGPLRLEEVDTVFTDTNCVVRLPGGRQWGGVLYAEIESSCAKVQARKGGVLQLALPKKVPLLTWPSLLKPLGTQELVPRLRCQENGQELSPIALDPGPEPRRAKQEARNQKRAQGRGEVGSGAGPGAQAGPSAKRAVHLCRGPEGEGSRDGPGPQGDASPFLADPAPQVEAEEQLCVPPLNPQTCLLGSEKNLALLAGEKSVSPRNDPVSPAVAQIRDPGKDDLVKEEMTVATDAATLVDEPESMVNLAFVKNDSYEKGPDSVVVHVYVKEIHRDTSRVLFREQDFTLIFQTRDGNFLRLHPGCGPHTIFRWQVKLRNLIEPEHCTFCFTASRIDICLHKRQSQRWGGLEAPAARGAVGGAKVAVPTGPTPLDSTPPGGTPHPLTGQEEARAMEKDKSKARSEDTGLDGVVTRTTLEHVVPKPEPHLASPKPTCMVPPMPHSPVSGDSVEEEEEEEKKVCLPGFTGLVNLGNTCFMNSVIQSLSNTRELRDFFHDRSFEAEINYNNPLGTGGRLAIGFAVLLRALWKGTHHAFQPSKLKAIVASKASQFTGYAQHDAQEFMAFLLDGLHEDLNRIQNKPYTETVDSDGRPDEVVAEEAWQRHKMRNDSFIVDLFQGQYKSKLVCPVCAKVSITFDPFLYLPVPLPQKQKVLPVFYFAREPHSKPIKVRSKLLFYAIPENWPTFPIDTPSPLLPQFLVSVSKENSSVSEVLDSLSQSVHVKPENLRLAEVIKNRFHRIFLPSHSLDTVSPSDMLLCFELLSPELAKERVVVLEAIVASKASQFTGYAQHDAQEFMAFLLDGLHEDLNRIQNKPYTETVDSDGRPDEVVAEEAWQRHKMRNDSFIVDLFQGQYKSKLVCPVCAKVSITFDPFLYLPVPLPQKQKVLPVFYFAREPHSKPIKFLVSVSKENSSVSEVLDSLSQSVHVKPENLRLAEVIKNRFHRIFLPSHSLDTVSPSDMLLCFELLSPELAKERVVVLEVQQRPQVPSVPISKCAACQRKQQSEDEKLKRCTRCYRVGYCNQLCQKTHWPDHKGLCRPENIGYPFLVSVPASRLTYARLAQLLVGYARCSVSVFQPPFQPGRMALGSQSPGCTILLSNSSLEAEDGEKESIKLPKLQLVTSVAEGDMEVTQGRHHLSGVMNVAVRIGQQTGSGAATEGDCLVLAFLWPLLRPFSFRSFIWRDKINDLVEFPVRYVITNHCGGMIGAHYTACARLAKDRSSQREHTDSRIGSRGGGTCCEVVTRYAYVLFYRRRNSPVERPPRAGHSEHRPDQHPAAEAAA